MLRDERCGRQGESLVEVLVAGTILLILLSALYTAVRFASHSLEKTRQLLADAAAVQAKLREQDEQTYEGYGLCYRFHTEGADASSDSLFELTVGCYSRTVEDQDGDPIQFFVFGDADPDESPP